MTDAHAHRFARDCIPWLGNIAISFCEEACAALHEIAHAEEIPQMNMPKISGGLGGLLAFCNFLEESNVTYSIHKYGWDALTVFFTVVGARVEVQFSEDRWDYSVFTGKEDVLDDEEALADILRKFLAD